MQHAVEVALCLLLIYKPGTLFVFENQEALPGNAFGILMCGGIHMSRHADKRSRSQQTVRLVGPSVTVRQGLLHQHKTQTTAEIRTSKAGSKEEIT